jgi:hypothetical protein
VYADAPYFVRGSGAFAFDACSTDCTRIRDRAADTVYADTAVFLTVGADTFDAGASVDITGPTGAFDTDAPCSSNAAPTDSADTFSAGSSAEDSSALRDETYSACRPLDRDNAASLRNALVHLIE